MKSEIVPLLPPIVILVALFIALRRINFLSKREPWTFLVCEYGVKKFDGKLKSETIHIEYNNTFKSYRFFRLGCNESGLAIVPERLLTWVFPSMFIPWNKLEKSNRKKKIWLFSCEGLISNA